MKIGQGLAATGLATALLASGGCGANTAAGSQLRVGSAEWVLVEKPVIQQYANDNEQLMPGDHCVTVRGAELAIQGSSVIYKDKDAFGTECPDGADISMTPSEAESQNGLFLAYITRKQQVVSQVSKMSGRLIGKPMTADGIGWVTLVNPNPEVQDYTNTSKTLGYGDTCLAEGTTAEIGQLSTGETVMEIIDPGQVGTFCPTGTLYLE